MTVPLVISGAMRAPKVSAATLEAAKGGDSEALSSIYLAYAPDLFRFFRAGLRDKHTAEDLVAGVFLSVIEALPHFRGPVEAFGGWLFQIARHDLADHRRQVTRHPVESLDDRLNEVELALGRDQGIDPQEAVETRVEGERVLAAMATLPATQRDVLLLRIAGGLTTVEVALAMRKTVGAVKALQHRALANLGRLMDDGEAVSAARTGPRSPGHQGRRGRE
jgi:RNA polymerase sigma-70 factor (ECF subfamily)